MYPTTITSWALLIARAAEESGQDSVELFQKAGLDHDKLLDPNSRYSFEGITRLWRLATRHTGDPCFGIKAARHWHPTTMHALGYAWMASTTLKEALQRLVRYSHVLATAIELTLEDEEDTTKLVISNISNREHAIEAADAAFAVLTNMCRTSYGKNFHPLQLTMMREKPSCEQEFNDYFNTPITYSSNENSISFSRDILEERLPTANTELARVNDEILTNYLAQLDKNNISAQVKSTIINLLPSGSITEQSIAQSLNKSRRSLQRKLTESGTSYKTLLQATRQELAEQYVSDSRYTINEITYLLGFSEPSNFSRAFKRWTNQSPSQYRAAHNSRKSA